MLHVRSMIAGKGKIGHNANLRPASLAVKHRYYTRSGILQQARREEARGCDGKDVEKRRQNSTFCENWGYGELEDGDLAAPVGLDWLYLWGLAVGALVFEPGVIGRIRT